MEISRQQKGSELHLAVSGRLDGTWSGALDKELSDAISGGAHQIRLDLAQVQFISSAGIRVLLKAIKELSAIQGSLAVTAASENVRSVLEVTGLAKALEQAGKERKPAPAADSRTIHHESIDLKIFPLPAGRPIELRLAGNAGALGKSASVSGGAVTVPLRPETMAIGIGAFGTGGDSLKRLGECIAVCGAAACLPSEKAAGPDFLISSATFTPEISFLHALVWPAQFTHLLRFENHGPPAGIPLSELAKIAFVIAGGKILALGMIAETSGLVGAALKRSPLALTGPEESRRSSPNGMAAGAKNNFYEYPEIKKRFSFAPEPVFGRALTLSAGIAALNPEAPLAACLRPLGYSGQPAGHFHGAIFERRPLQNGLIDLRATAHSLFQQETLRGVMHLLNDPREIAGAGESRFVRGALWIGTVEKVIKE